MPRRCTALEDLDDDHAATAAGTRWLVVIGSVDGLALGLGGGEQFAGARDVIGGGAFGEQAVVADAVEALGQDVDEKAADELVGCQRHLPVSVAPLDPVVLPLEGDTSLVACDQAA